jgi:hypothetical protein
MSDLYAIGMIGTLFIAACFFNHHIVQMINRRNIEIVSGVAVGGVPITHEMRWRTLMTLQVLAAGFTAALNLVMAYCFMTIGNHVVAPDVRLLAQVCAWIYISFSAVVLIVAPTTIVGISRLLRQAEAD